MLWVAGCAHVPTAPESQSVPVTSPAAAVPAPSAAAPPFRSPAEDPKDGPCIKTTHGCIALNPEVDEDTIDVTICDERPPHFVVAGGRFERYTHRRLQVPAVLASRPLLAAGHPRLFRRDSGVSSIRAPRACIGTPSNPPCGSRESDETLVPTSFTIFALNSRGCSWPTATTLWHMITRQSCESACIKPPTRNLRSFTRYV